MKHLTKWWVQLMFAAPFVPWLMVHHVDITYQVAIGFGWIDISAGIVTTFFTLIAMVMLGLGFIRTHSGEWE